MAGAKQGLCTVTVKEQPLSSSGQDGQSRGRLTRPRQRKMGASPELWGQSGLCLRHGVGGEGVTLADLGKIILWGAGVRAMLRTEGRVEQGRQPVSRLKVLHGQGPHGAVGWAKSATPGPKVQAVPWPGWPLTSHQGCHTACLGVHSKQVLQQRGGLRHRTQEPSGSQSHLLSTLGDPRPGQAES